MIEHRQPVGPVECQAVRLDAKGAPSLARLSSGFGKKSCKQGARARRKEIMRVSAELAAGDGTGAWSTDGCYTAELDDGSGNIGCQCDHLSEFIAVKVASIPARLGSPSIRRHPSSGVPARQPSSPLLAPARRYQPALRTRLSSRSSTSRVRSRCTAHAPRAWRSVWRSRTTCPLETGPGCARRDQILRHGQETLHRNRKRSC